jgi:hypothetical protein
MTTQDNISASGDQNAWPPDAEKLLQYMSGNLSEAECLVFEKQLEQDPMLRDALEGFASLDLNTSAIKELDKAVNTALWNQVRKRKKRSLLRNGKYKFPIWIYIIAVLIILLLCVLIFFL